MLILASQSPRRAELMKLITDDFRILPSGFDESGVREEDPVLLVRRLAACKAAFTAPEPGDCVIGCDTVVVLDGRVFGKPKGREDAYAMLRALSGRRHTVLSGVCVRKAGEDGRGLWERSFECATEVEFYPLSDEEIERYLDTGEPFDKAGAYGIQGKGGLLVRGISGDYNNVVGLPVAGLARLLHETGELRFL